MADELTIRMAITGVTAVESGIKRVEDALTRTRTKLGSFNRGVSASIGLINGFSSVASMTGNKTMKDLAVGADMAALAISNLKNSASLLTNVRMAGWVGAAVAGVMATYQAVKLMGDISAEKGAKESLAKVNEKLADSIMEIAEAQLAQGLISEKQAEEFLTQAYLAKNGNSGVSPDEMSGRLTGIAGILFKNQGKKEDEATAREMMTKLRRAQIAAGMNVNVAGQLAEFDAVENANANVLAIEELKLNANQKRELLLANERVLQAELNKIEAENKKPFGFRENMLANLETVRKQFDDTGKMIADTLNNTIGTAVNSISQQFTQLILGAQTWGQTLKNIGLSIVTELIQSIIRMGIMWVLQHTIMKGASIALETTRTVAAVAGSKARAVAVLGENQAQAVLVAAQAASSVASIPYVGWALAASAFASMLATITAANVVAGVANMGFSEGGYTGNGGTGAVAGVVHGREFVFSAPAVETVGLGNLQAMHDSAVRGGGGGAAAAGGGVKIGFINSAAERREFMRTDPEMRKILIDIVTGAKQEIGVA
jgi:hypothetical protein